MKPKDAARSPIKLALKENQDRLARMIIREKEIEKQYGFKTCRNSEVPDRFMKGLPSQDIPVATQDFKKMQKSVKAIEEFEKLNGISSSARLIDGAEEGF